MAWAYFPGGERLSLCETALTSALLTFPAHSPHRDPGTGRVVLGAHALRTKEATQQVFSISAVITHPDYQPTTHTSDICLLQVTHCVGIGPSVQVGPVPTPPLTMA